MARSIFSALVVGIMTFGAGSLQADVVHLDDGSRIVGTVEDVDATHAHLSGTFNGALQIPRSAISRIETDDSVTVRFDDTYLTGRIQPAGEDAMVLEVDDLGPRPLDLAEVTGVYRDDPLDVQRRELAMQVAATANVGVALTSGNSESENFHLDGQIVARNRRSRYTVSGEYNEEESRDVLVKRNWAGLVKYDYFVSDRWFWFNSVTMESDEFADLELRTALAAGVGYQFFDTATRSLSLEAGPSYVDENFDTAADQSFFGSRWALRYDQALWWNLSYYLYNEGLQGLEDTSDLTIRTRTGLNIDISERIIARIQTAIDWDNSPPEGADATDFEHTLTIGYRF